MANPSFWPWALFVGLLGFYLGISYFIGFFGRDFDQAEHRRLVETNLSRAENASVDIFLPICGEPHEIIQNTWDYVQELRSIHHFIKVYVLDDGHSAIVERMAKEYAFKYISRENNELKKAGNLRNAFRQTHSEFIAIFDADFCPRKDFLLETIPYFNDPCVAIVQTPQYFDAWNNQNWLQRGAGSIQELFYRLIQVNRNTFNGAICVGTNAVYRRTALEPFGGTAPMPYSEDVHTGFQVQADGWKIKYIPINLAKGLCPDRVKQFFTQQYRWAMGSISLFFSIKFWVADISWRQRVCYLSGMLYYMVTGIFSVIGFLPSVVLLIWLPEKIFWYNLLFSVPSFLFSTVYMWYWSKQGYGIDALRSRSIAYMSHLFALIDFLRRRPEEWKSTGSMSRSERFDDFLVVYQIINWVFPGIIVGMSLYRISEGYLASSFCLLWAFTAVNLYLANPDLVKRS